MALRGHNGDDLYLKRSEVGILLPGLVLRIRTRARESPNTPSIRWIIDGITPRCVPPSTVYFETIKKQRLLQSARASAVSPPRRPFFPENLSGASSYLSPVMFAAMVRLEYAVLAVVSSVSYPCVPLGRIITIKRHLTTNC